jgi:dihydroorotate dehydrogenase/NAD-dependent dihydropyrimidine dehydrogenase PreA subunit
MEYRDTAELVKQAKNETGLVVLCNITHMGTDTDGWVIMGKTLQDAGADALELNLNCPNITSSAGGKASGLGAIAGQDKELCRSIITALKKYISIPIIPKLPYRVADISEVAHACKEAGADAVTLASGYPSLPPVNIYERGKCLNPFHTGVSVGSWAGDRGSLMHSFANVALVAKRVELPIIGGGGIRTWEDGIQMMMWGAGAVSACWLVIYQGFSAIKRVVDGMDRFMDQQGYGSYQEITGLALPNLRPGPDIDVIPHCAQINRELCNQCQKCVSIGHCEAISEIAGQVAVDDAFCTGCGVCRALCPRKAISMAAR